MKDIKVPFLPRIESKEAKEIAETFLRKNNFLSDDTSYTRLPINVEILANKSGHPVEFFSDLRSRFDSKGTAYYNLTNKCLEIYIDSSHYMDEPLSSPFTIAEELSHIILHASIFEQISSPEDRIILEQNTKESTHHVIEKQAKIVASELLLPTFLYSKFLFDWFSQNLELIKNERPANESDFLDFLGRKLGDKLGLSSFIIKRALLRCFDGETLISHLVKNFKIIYLENIPPKSTSLSSDKK